MTDIIWTPAFVRLGEIEPWEHNPRQSSKKTAAELNNTLDEFGQPQPFTLGPKRDDGKYPCYDGHQRYGAWKAKHGAEFKVFSVIASRPLTDTERRKYVIKFHASAVGQWNPDEISTWDAAQIQSWNVDEAIKGWEAAAKTFKTLLASEQPTADAEPQTDRAAELLEKWGVKPGDLWQIGEHRLICGDCTDAATVARVMGGEKARMVFTSPPYNSAIGGVKPDYYGKQERFYKDKQVDKKTKQEWLGFCDLVLNNCATVVDEDSAVVWNVMYNANMRDAYGLSMFAGGHPFTVKETICWDKVHGFNIATKGILSRNWELVFVLSIADEYFTTQGTDETRYGMWRIGTEGAQIEGVHNAAFPVELAERAAGWFSEAGDIVLEPFCGTGTVLVACENLGRRGRACELSPAYVAVALERMATAFPHLEIRRIQ